MYTHFLMQSLKGLQSAAVPACSCAKGLAVGISELRNAVQGFQQSLEPQQAAAEQQSQLQQPLLDVQRSAPSTRLSDLLETDGMLAAQHAVYMRTLMLHHSSRHE